MHRVIKMLRCPHCGSSGFLILHGYLRGYRDDEDGRVIRGHRIFCSNRNRKRGCGRTFSVLLAGFIRHCVVTARTVWRILEGVLKGLCVFVLYKQSFTQLGLSSLYRIYHRFCSHQSWIRSFLIRVSHPPGMPSERHPVRQTIRHLMSVFSGEACPIEAFQHRFGACFFHI